MSGQGSTMFGLEGKGVIITGASQGLGRAAAPALAQAGARLCLMARSGEKLEEVRAACPQPDRHLCLPVDLTDLAALADAVDRAQDFLGGADVALHAAGGGLGLRDPLLDAPSLARLFALNLAAPAEINRLVVPGMVERGWGRLVHVCSVAAVEAVASVGYNTVKGGLAAYVRTLGNLMAAHQVVVTGILPGAFQAPENSWARLERRNPQAVADFIERRLPRKRLAEAEELLPLLLFLCGDAASMMGGCLVPIDAGEGKAFLAT